MWESFALDEIASFTKLAPYLNMNTSQSSGSASQGLSPLKTPGEEDVTPFGAVITYPKTRDYLPSYEVRYVKAPKGNSIYVFWNPDGGESYRRKYLLYEGDEVIELARQGGFSCVIFTSRFGDQQIGWANTDFLIW